MPKIVLKKGPARFRLHDIKKTFVRGVATHVTDEEFATLSELYIEDDPRSPLFVELKPKKKPEPEPEPKRKATGGRRAEV